MEIIPITTLTTSPSVTFLKILAIEPTVITDDQRTIKTCLNK